MFLSSPATEQAAVQPVATFESVHVASYVARDGKV